KGRSFGFSAFVSKAGHPPAPQRGNRPCGARDFSDDSDLSLSIAGGIRRRQYLKRQSEEGVARKYRARFAKSLVASRPSPPQIVVVHRRQVIMDQGVGMNHLDR